jgi:hypothetical protein
VFATLLKEPQRHGTVHTTRKEHTDLHENRSIT